MAAPCAFGARCGLCGALLYRADCRCCRPLGHRHALGAHQTLQGGGGDGLSPAVQRSVQAHSAHGFTYTPGGANKREGGKNRYTAP